MNKSVTWSILTVCLLLLSGCASVATIKTAESSKKGEINLGIGVSGKINVGKERYPAFYGMEPYVVYGVTDDIDVEARYLWGPIIGAKYTHYQKGKHSAAIDASLGMVGFNGLLKSPEITDFYSSILFSRRFKLVHTLTIGPKFIARFPRSSDSQYYYGVFVNARFKMNPTVHITPELTYLSQDSILRLVRDEADGMLAFSIGFNHQF